MEFYPYLPGRPEWADVQRAHELARAKDPHAEGFIGWEPTPTGRRFLFQDRETRHTVMVTLPALTAKKK